jgi:hypothetical protein
MYGKTPPLRDISGASEEKRLLLQLFEILGENYGRIWEEDTNPHYITEGGAEWALKRMYISKELSDWFNANWGDCIRRK